jgi:hypothetical protein
LNKAFVREPDADSRVPCPRCGAAGISVGNGPLQTYVPDESRAQLIDSALYCSNTSCDVAYFNMFEQFVRVEDLTGEVYPYNPDAPICPCFGFTLDDVIADVDCPQPLRIRELLAKSKSPDARCAKLAIDGQCCMKEIQRVYMKLRSEQQSSH